MEVTNSERDGNNLKLDIRIEPRRVNEALEQAYRKVVKEVSVPGFRKGKVPREVLEAKYGKEVLHKDALDILIPEAYSLAVEEVEAEPIARPDIEDLFIEEDEYATFTATVEVMPEVELGQYTDLNIEKEEVEVTEEDVNEVLENLQQQHSQLELSDKTVVEEGDTAVIDFEGSIDGETFPGGSAEEFNLEIGSGNFIPGFEEKLIGQEVGIDVEFEISFPEDYRAEDLAGETATFEVAINEIKEKATPDLDDDFAREVSEFETIEEFREEIESNLKEQQKNEIEQEFSQELFNAIAETSEVDIPETLIENELDNMFKKFSYSISRQGMKVEDYLEYMGQDEEEWRDQNYEEAFISVRNNLLLETIAEEEGIEVSDEEVDNKIEEYAEENEQDQEKLKQQLESSGQMASIKHNIRMEKTMDFLQDNN